MEKDAIIFNVDNRGQVTSYFPFLADTATADMNLCFGIYMREQARIALEGTYVPQEMIYYKPYEVHPQNDKADNFLNYLVTHNLTESLPKIPLRLLTYAYESCPGQIKVLSDMDSFMEEMRHSPDKQKRFNEYERYHGEKEKDIHNRTIIAIENNNGVLLFCDSGRGFQYKNNYLQYMADNYFSPEYKNLEFVKMYYFSTSNKELVELSQQCASMFSADTGHLFIPQKAGYLSDRITDKISPADECSMEPDREGYQNFIGKFQLDKSFKNTNIAILVDIARHGIVNLNEKDLPEFKHKSSFEGILYQFRSHAISPVHQFLREKLEDAARDIARRILQNEYNVRGYEHPEHHEQKAKQVMPKI